MLELDSDQRQTVHTELKRYELEDYARALELVILGHATGEEILMLVRVFNQTSYLKGRFDSAGDLNQVIKGIVIID